MVLSAKDRLSTANRRAVVSRFVWCASAAFSAISFQVFQIGPAQNLPIRVCSGVLVVLVFCPRLFTSSRVCAYVWLVNAGGGAGRNCAALFSTKGVTLPQVVKAGAGNFGGVGW